MRWIWTLAIACIIAATGVRPEQELRAEHAGQIDRAPATTLQHLSIRPGAAQPVRHTPVAIVPTAPQMSPPPRALALAPASSLDVSPAKLAPAPWARGPPIG